MGEFDIPLEEIFSPGEVQQLVGPDRMVGLRDLRRLTIL